MDICKVDGAIEYLVKMLNYQAPSGTLVIVESVGGILRNISSIIALREDYRWVWQNHDDFRTSIGCLFSFFRKNWTLKSFVEFEPKLKLFWYD